MRAARFRNEEETKKFKEEVKKPYKSVVRHST
jgi:hypothetical protein